MGLIELVTDKDEVVINCIESCNNTEISIDWGDGVPEPVNGLPQKHKYSTHEVHHINIIGNVKKIIFNDAFKSFATNNNQGLEEIYCRSNSHLISLNVKECPALKVLNCHSNGLEALDVSETPNLEILDCSWNLLKELDLTGNMALKELVCNKNFLPDLNVKNHDHLEYLNCSDNELTFLDIKGCPALNRLDCSRNKLKTLEIKDSNELKELSCKDNCFSPETIFEIRSALPENFDKNFLFI